MSQIANPNYETHDGGLIHMGFKIYQDEKVPEYLGVFTAGANMINGVRQVDAVGTINWLTGQVHMSKGSKADSIYVHPKRYNIIRAELSKKFAQDKSVNKPLEDARKAAHG